jgi:tripartite motif-containing protein 71
VKDISNSDDKENLKLHYRQFIKPNKSLLCLILFFISLMSISITHAEEYKFVTKWGSYYSVQFCIPQGTAVDSSGNLYVADTDNNLIKKFDSNGKCLAQWGSFGNGNGEFYEPHGIAVDSSGNVYVADTDNYRIQKFDSNGTYIMQWGAKDGSNGKFYLPHGIAVDSSGKVYVADYYNNRIQKFDSNGTYIMQ